MVHVDENSMVEFITYLIETTGHYTVLTDRTIQNNATKELVTFKIANKSNAPLRIFKEGDPVQGYAYLQPFREYSTNSAARKWFYDLCTDTPLIVIKDLMVKAAELAASKEATDPDALEVVNKILDKTDKTTADEIRKIAISELGSIYYNKAKKEASFNLFHLGPSIRKAYPKIREKTWDVIEQLICSFLDDDNLDPEAIVSHTATLLNIPESESKLQVVVAILVKLANYVTIFLGKDIHDKELSRHISMLNGYHKLQLYLNADTSFPAQETVVRPAVNPILQQPYQQNMMPPPILQQQQAPVRQGPPKANKAPAIIPRAGADTTDFKPNIIPPAYGVYPGMQQPPGVQLPANPIQGGYYQQPGQFGAQGYGYQAPTTQYFGNQYAPPNIYQDNTLI